jgi:LuxR family transcriptional regulator, maltose regulon positive regulatory protein
MPTTLKGSAFVAQALMAPARGADSAPGLAPVEIVGHSRPGAGNGALSVNGTGVRSRVGLVPRERLVRLLLDARDVQVALVIAPAGYGKTTLLSEWASRDDRPFAWVTLDEADNDPATLLSSVALALDAIEPIGWEVFEALSSQRPDAAAVALEGLTAALSCRELSCVLALDDVHVLKAPASRRLLTAIGRALLPGSQLGLVGRSDSALPVGRLRAQGSSLELRAEQLAMTRSEGAALLREARVELTPEEVLSLMRRTEGWAAGLHLAALSLREQNGDRPEGGRFAGDDRFVSEYVREEFLSELSVAELEFLTRTSVLEHLSGPVCDAVLDHGGSAEMLARLARSGVMLVPLDRSDTTYRYHRLFADVLGSELRRLEPDLRPGLHRRASDWYEDHGDARRAIEHAIAAHDVPRAGRLIWDSAPQRENDEVIDSWLRSFTEDERSGTPILALAAAGRCLVAGDLYQAERWSLLAGPAPGETNRVQAGIAVMEAALGQAGVARMGADASRARALLGDRSPWHPIGLYFEGVARHLTGDRAPARQQLREGAHRAAVSAPLFQTLCLAQLALLVLEEGDQERATTLAARAVAQIERCGLHESPMVALVIVVSATLCAERGRMAEARVEQQRALALLGEIADPSPWYEAECRILLARVALRLNALTRAREHLETASAALRRMPDAGLLTEWLETARAQVDAALDSTAEADWSLTTAELRVLHHLPSHLSFREIAERLFVSPNTVKTHARGIYRKLGVSCRGGAVERARHAGLVDPAGGEENRNAQW